MYGKQLLLFHEGIVMQFGQRHEDAWIELAWSAR